MDLTVKQKRYAEDDLFSVRIKGKGKGKDGKGKDGKGGPPDPKRQKTDGAPEDEEEEEEKDFDVDDWLGKLVALFGLKGAPQLNGKMANIKDYDEEKKRFTVIMKDDKAEKSVKKDNLVKTFAGALVRISGLDEPNTALNMQVAECGLLEVNVEDFRDRRYDVRLKDGRHIRLRPMNVELIGWYEQEKVLTEAELLTRFRVANGLKDRIGVIESLKDYPVPEVVPASALSEYAKKHPKSIVIGHSNVAQPKGVQALMREIVSASAVPSGARLVFASTPREQCATPAIEKMRHDELLRLGKLAGWLEQYLKPKPVYFLIPGACVKDMPSMQASASCSWFCYHALCDYHVIVHSARWHTGAWPRLDATIAGQVLKKPLYLLPEKYEPPKTVKPPPKQDEDIGPTPLSTKPAESLAVGRASEGTVAHGPTLIPELVQAVEKSGAEISISMKVKKLPTQ
eukprot:gnl/MRDRNA2_/MRDRNA2_122081_c0_seq1.p1 gnl/MRDRNA2_/MRDRNA2_122081_c0~~gnl/MRDRNA2_/MRDRNA2_122081_c0_seq1.p1  ORF type:complete len:455 (+),score=106.98 gnl/MRDRNA2_/MRDRNA2_122081_c0_seq1:60-1424(+)